MTPYPQVKFRLSLALMFTDRTEAALSHTRDALEQLRLAKQDLEKELEELDADVAGAEEAGEKLLKQMSDVDGSVADLAAHEEELAAAVAEARTIKDAIK